MRSVREGTAGAWERLIVRYFATYTIPLKWSYQDRRFLGIAGLKIVRINPRSGADTKWALIPQHLKKHEGERGNGNPCVILVTNKQYGDSVDDTIAVMKLSTLMPILKVWYQFDVERNSENVTTIIR